MPIVERFDGQLPYDPACVFHLEMMISLASRGKQHIAETWSVICTDHGHVHELTKQAYHLRIYLLTAELGSVVQRPTNRASRRRPAPAVVDCLRDGE